MKGFQLDDKGDIIIVNGHIQMIDGNELLRQTVQSVLGTNKGEWILNTDEGIVFSNILGKGNAEGVIRNEIQQGLLQVDSSFVLTSFVMNLTEDRRFKIAFTATNSTGDKVSAENYYG